MFACSLSLKAEVRCSPAGDPPKVCGKMQGVDICETFPVNVVVVQSPLFSGIICAPQKLRTVFFNKKRRKVLHLLWGRLRHREDGARGPR